MHYTEIQTINRIKNLASSLDRRDHPEHGPPGFLGLSDKEVLKYSFSRAASQMVDVMNGHKVNGGFNGFEAECSRELEKSFGACNPSRFYVPRDLTHSRAMATVPGAKGGYLAPADLVGFVDTLQNYSVCFAFGAQRLQDQSANPVFVKEKTGPTITWQAGDGTSTTPADPVFGQLTGTPHAAIAIHELSELLLQQTSPVMELGIRRGLGLGLASAIDAAMLTGSGGAQPVGITNTVGINTVVGTALDRTKLIDMQTQAHNNNAVSNATTQGVATTPTVAALLAGRQQYTATDSPLWLGPLARGSVIGVPAMCTKNVTAGSLIYGDFSQLLLVEFGPLQIAVNRSDTRFNQGVVAMRALWMVDVLVLEPKAFTVATSVT